MHLIDVPWARKGSAFTLLFEQAALALVREMPVLAAARLMKVTDTRLWRVVQHDVQKTVAGVYSDASRPISGCFPESAVTIDLKHVQNAGIYQFYSVYTTLFYHEEGPVPTVRISMRQIIEPPQYPAGFTLNRSGFASQASS